MEDSILTTVKKLCGVANSYEAFDMDFLIHINSALSTLTQLGIGPPEGFQIEDATAKWVDFLGDVNRLNLVKSYVGLRVRLIFDPPSNPSVINAMQEQIREYEFRINVIREEWAWVDPDSPPVIDDIEGAISETI